ncbi:hypothetical protein KM043_000275 [Ampulex compressa]|nr:hypothetical protein KM043_000275 [Ampulex compressa]
MVGRGKRDRGASWTRRKGRPSDSPSSRGYAPPAEVSRLPALSPARLPRTASFARRPFSVGRGQSTCAQVYLREILGKEEAAPGRAEPLSEAEPRSRARKSSLGESRAGGLRGSSGRAPGLGERRPPLGGHRGISRSGRQPLPGRREERAGGSGAFCGGAPEREKRASSLGNGTPSASSGRADRPGRRGGLIRAYGTRPPRERGRTAPEVGRSSRRARARARESSPLPLAGSDDEASRARDLARSRLSVAPPRPGRRAESRNSRSRRGRAPSYEPRRSYLAAFTRRTNAAGGSDSRRGRGRGRGGRLEKSATDAERQRTRLRGSEAKRGPRTPRVIELPGRSGMAQVRLVHGLRDKEPQEIPIPPCSGTFRPLLGPRDRRPTQQPRVPSRNFPPRSPPRPQTPRPGFWPSPRRWPDLAALRAGASAALERPPATRRALPRRGPASSAPRRPSFRSPSSRSSRAGRAARDRAARGRSAPLGAARHANPPGHRYVETAIPSGGHRFVGTLSAVSLLPSRQAPFCPLHYVANPDAGQENINLRVARRSSDPADAPGPPLVIGHDLLPPPPGGSAASRGIGTARGGRRLSVGSPRRGGASRERNLSRRGGAPPASSFVSRGRARRPRWNSPLEWKSLAALRGQADDSARRSGRRAREERSPETSAEGASFRQGGPGRALPAADSGLDKSFAGRAD